MSATQISTQDPEPQPMDEKEIASTLVYGFCETARALQDGHDDATLLEGEIRAAATVLIRALIDALRELSVGPEAQAPLERALTEATDQVIREQLEAYRRQGMELPGELTRSLQDVFVSGFHGMLRNAILIYQYETAQWAARRLLEDGPPRPEARLALAGSFHAVGPAKDGDPLL